MTEEKLLQIIESNETQTTEFKKSTAEKEQICETICAFANSDGGIILVGVKPDKTLSKVSFSDQSQTDISNLFTNFDPDLKRLVSINTTPFKGYFLLVIEVQKSNIQHHCYKGKCYKRIGASNQPLSNQEWFELRKNYKQDDWSAQICEGATIEDLDEVAVMELRERLVIAKNNNEYKSLEIKNLLNRINLLTDGKINNTCLLFLGKTEITDKFLFDKNKISWVYKDELNDIEERLNIDEIKKPFIILLPEIQRNIQRFNTYLKDLDLFREDIRQYEEKAIEELLVNAIAHRDWEIRLWVEVVQTPSRLEIRNPGEFLADWDKVLKYNQKPPYKNSNLVDFLNHIKLMEREGDGLRKVYKAQVGKGLEVIKRTEVPDRVDVILTGKVKNIEFARFVLARRGDIEINDIRILERIAKGENKLERDIQLEIAKELKEKGLVDIDWKRKICNFSHKFSKDIGLLGKRRRFEKLTKTQEEAEIINFLNENRIGEVKNDFMQIFEHKGYTHDMVYNIIRRLKSKKIVVKKDRYRWKLINAVNNEITATDGENDDNKNSKTLLNREKQMPSTTK